MIRARAVRDEDVHIMSKCHTHIDPASSAARELSHREFLLAMMPPSRKGLPQPSPGLGRNTFDTKTNVRPSGSPQRSANVTFIPSHQPHAVPGTCGIAARDALQPFPREFTETQPETRAANRTAEKGSKEILQPVLQDKVNQDALNNKHEYVKHLSKSWAQKHAMEMQRRNMGKSYETLVKIDSNPSDRLLHPRVGNVAKNHKPNSSPQHYWHGASDIKAIDTGRHAPQPRAKAALKRIQQEKEFKLKFDIDKRKRLEEVEMQTLHAKKGAQNGASCKARAASTNMYTHTQPPEQARATTASRARETSLEIPLTLSVEEQYREFFTKYHYVPPSSQPSTSMHPELEYLLSSPDSNPVANSDHESPSPTVQNRRHDQTHHPFKSVSTKAPRHTKTLANSSRGRSARNHGATSPKPNIQVPIVKSKQAHTRSRSLSAQANASERSRSIRKRATSAPNRSLRRRKSSVCHTPNFGRRRRRQRTIGEARAWSADGLTRLPQQRDLGLDVLNDLNIAVSKALQDLQDRFITYMQVRQKHLAHQLQSQPLPPSSSAIDKQSYIHPETFDLTATREAVRANLNLKPIPERTILNLSHETPSPSDWDYLEEPLEEPLTKFKVTDQVKDSALGYWKSPRLRPSGDGPEYTEATIEEGFRQVSENRSLQEQDTDTPIYMHAHQTEYNDITFEYTPEYPPSREHEAGELDEQITNTEEWVGEYATHAPDDKTQQSVSELRLGLGLKDLDTHPENTAPRLKSWVPHPLIHLVESPIEPPVTQTQTPVDGVYTYNLCVEDEGMETEDHLQGISSDDFETTATSQADASEGSLTTKHREIMGQIAEQETDVSTRLVVTAPLESEPSPISATELHEFHHSMGSPMSTNRPSGSVQVDQSFDYGEDSTSTTNDASDRDVVAQFNDTEPKETKSALSGIISYGSRRSLQQRIEEREEILSLVQGYGGELESLIGQLSHGLLQSLTPVPLEHLQASINLTEPKDESWDVEEVEEPKANSPLPPIRSLTIMEEDEEEGNDLYELSPSTPVPQVRSQSPPQSPPEHKHQEGCDCPCDNHQRALQWISARMLFIDALLGWVADEDLMPLFTNPKPPPCPEAEGELFEFVLQRHILDIKDCTDLAHVSEDHIMLHAVAAWDEVYEILSSIHSDRHVRFDRPRTGSRFPRTNRASSICNGMQLKAEILRRAVMNAEQQEKQIMLCAEQTLEGKCICLCTYEATRDWRHEGFYEELCDVEDQMIDSVADGIAADISRSVVNGL